MHCSKQDLLFDHFVGAHQERLLITEASVVAWSRQARGEHSLRPFPEEAVLHDCDAVRG
jgi:hypothetical protein